jgi:hypothetical protein
MTEGTICPVEAGGLLVGASRRRIQSAIPDARSAPTTQERKGGRAPRIEDNGPSRRPISTSRIGSMSPDPSTKRSPPTSSKILNVPIGHNQPGCEPCEQEDGGQLLCRFVGHRRSDAGVWAPRREASDKRQGTKSRGCGRRDDGAGLWGFEVGGDGG